MSEQAAREFAAIVLVAVQGFVGGALAALVGGSPVVILLLVLWLIRGSCW